jgi:hypothetical protein
MELTIIPPVVIALLFGLVVAGVAQLIAGGAWSTRAWLSIAFVYACFCYIILFGPIRI